MGVGGGVREAAGVNPALLLTADELHQLTGYRQHARQLQWLRECLRLSPPLRADGMPIVSRAQLEAALISPAGTPAPAAAGPRWSKIAA